MHARARLCRRPRQRDLLHGDLSRPSADGARHRAGCQHLPQGGNRRGSKEREQSRDWQGKQVKSLSGVPAALRSPGPQVERKSGLLPLEVRLVELELEAPHARIDLDLPAPTHRRQRSGGAPAVRSFELEGQGPEGANERKTGSLEPTRYARGHSVYHSADAATNQVPYGRRYMLPSRFGSIALSPTSTPSLRARQVPCPA